MKIKIIIICIIGIIAVLGTIYLGQGGKTYTFANNALEQGKNYVTKGSNWIKDFLFSKIGGEVQKRGEELKNQASQSVSEKIKDYFSGVTNALLGKEKECQTTQTSD